MVNSKKVQRRNTRTKTQMIHYSGVVEDTSGHIGNPNPQQGQENIITSRNQCHESDHNQIVIRNNNEQDILNIRQDRENVVIDSQQINIASIKSENKDDKVQNEKSKGGELADRKHNENELQNDDAARNTTEQSNETIDEIIPVETISTEINQNPFVSRVTEISTRLFDFKETLSFFKNLEKKDVPSTISSFKSDDEVLITISNYSEETDINSTPSTNSNSTEPSSNENTSLERNYFSRMFSYNDLQSFWKKKS